VPGAVVRRDSGWWGLARKINYTGDWLITLSWCLLCGFKVRLAPCLGPYLGPHLSPYLGPYPGPYEAPVKRLHGVVVDTHRSAGLSPVPCLSVAAPTD